MRQFLNTKNRPLTIRVDVVTKRPERIRIVAFDHATHYAYYVNRGGIVRGHRTFELPMPKSPKQLTLIILNEANGEQSFDNSFSAKVSVVPLTTWQIWMKDKDKEFIEFAQWFSENAGILPVNRVYKSKKGKYQIRYFDVIRNRQTRKVIGTPARISNETGIIEVAKVSFLKYTIPMRMMILFHEYAHYNMNSDIRNEMQADVNGLYLYLGLGYPRIEAHKAFLNVFSNADTLENEKRYQIIKDYIERFDKGEIAKQQSVSNKLMAA